MLNWLKRPKFDASVERREMPSGLWHKCPRCTQLVYVREFERNAKVCPKCGLHHRLSAAERLSLVLDEGSFEEWDAGMTSLDPLSFPKYAEKAREARETTGRDDAVITGEGALDGVRAAVGAMDFTFLGGSMGAVVGERLARVFERARERALPAVTFSASGGARMQEGAISLMQLAKTTAAVARLHEARLPYISVLCDPTTGGTTASFAMLGDIHVAEPGALIGFAGRRVIEQTISQKLPDDFQTAEFLLKHGMIDMIVARHDLKSTLAGLLRLMQPRLGELGTAHDSTELRDDRTAAGR
jgi:acetyl-CoA carboxylase carboxyl transferase subunit beta